MWFTGTWYDGETHSVTRLMVQALQSACSFMQIAIAVFCPGEWVWRQHERKVHETIDTTAARDWAHVVPTVIAITLVRGATNAAGVLTGMAVQPANGQERGRQKAS